MEEIDVPSHFLCPISMQLMRDPVIVSTGITYDRESIERWLFSCRNSTCPVTKQSLLSEVCIDLTPNHTLRRLIQAWCTLNAVERIPTPKPPIDKTRISKLLKQAMQSPEMQQKCLQQLRSIANESETNKKLLASSGAVEFLASIINKNDSTTTEVVLESGSEFKRACDEALSILFILQTPETSLKKLINNDFEFVESLTRVLKFGNQQSRAQAIVLLKSVFKVADPSQMIIFQPDLFKEIVRILSDKVSQQASKAALKLLAEVCPWGRNRIKAVESGAVFALVELLIETLEKRACELAMVALDQLCGCAEGRAELLKHEAGLAIVSKKILRVSHGVTDRAVRVLSSISRFSANSRVLQEMLQVGVVAKLCLVVEMSNVSVKTEERAKVILKLHSRVWKSSGCIPAHLLSSYPS